MGETLTQVQGKGRSAAAASSGPRVPAIDKERPGGGANGRVSTRTRENASQITASTWVPLGGVIAAVALIVSVVIYGNNIVGRLDRIEERIGDSWTKSDMELFKSELKRMNHKLHVPGIPELPREER